jgi:hypothetical protein
VTTVTTSVAAAEAATPSKSATEAADCLTADFCPRKTLDFDVDDDDEVGETEHTAAAEG